MRCQDFSPLPRREGRAYPPAVCKERATLAAAKKTATRRAAPDLTGSFVAPQSQSAGGYAPSSRLATGQIWRSACIENSLSQYQEHPRWWGVTEEQRSRPLLTEISHIFEWRDKCYSHDLPAPSRSYRTQARCIVNGFRDTSRLLFLARPPFALPAFSG